MDYEINRATLAIVPIDNNTSKINEWISKLQTPVTTE